VAGQRGIGSAGGRERRSGSRRTESCGGPSSHPDWPLFAVRSANGGLNRPFGGPRPVGRFCQGVAHGGLPCYPAFCRSYSTWHAVRPMHNFAPIEGVLGEQFPGRFACQPGKQGHANGLSIRCSGRAGYAFIYEPNQNHQSYLLALRESDEDQNPEVWSTRDAAEVVQRIVPWAFPQAWRRPEPVDPAQERKRLQKIAKGISARTVMECRVSEPKSEFLSLLTSQGRRAFDHDIESLATDRIVHHFPWDAAGRPALKSIVLLAAYDTVNAPRKDRDLCLAAVGPEHRSEQVVRVELIDPILANQAHRWDRCPWLWTSAEVPVDELLGTASAGAADENQRAMEALAWLDEGRIEEALALYRVSVSDDLHRLLGGERISPPACCAHPDAAWTKLLVDTLRHAAPWRLPMAVASEAERLKAWAAQKKGRRRHAPSLKLVIFPGQHHSRKASLMLTGDVDGSNPHFVIEATASNARLHDTAWKRPIEVDFVRYGVEGPTGGPGSG